MSTLQRWEMGAAILLTAGLLSACGGGGSNSNATSTAPSFTAAPLAATDGLNWLNTRRAELGVPVLTRSALIDKAAQNHSVYQATNPPVSHDEDSSKSAYTGTTVLQRLNYVGYTFTGGYAYGEVISASNSTSGQYLAEELVTAIYHRFVIFEPRFKEIGAGAVTDSRGYSYFTTNFTSNNGFGPGIGANEIVTWPTNGQTGIPRNFMSDFESPDPVANANEVGYPISVHANIDATIQTSSFTIRPRGGANLTTKLLVHEQGMPPVGDKHTPKSAASIIPLAVLTAGTIYDVSFAGTVDGAPVSKTWSFTTKP